VAAGLAYGCISVQNTSPSPTQEVRPTGGGAPNPTLSLTASPSVAAPVATQVPVATPLATEMPVATPVATEVPVDVAAEFARQLLQAQELHAEVGGNIVIGPVTGTFGGEVLTAANGDVSRRIEITVPNAPLFASEEVSVAGVNYMGTNGGPLVRQPSSVDGSSDPADMAGFVFSIASATDEGEVTRNGRVLHHLVPSDNVAADPQIFGLTDPALQGVTASVDLYAEPDGTPAIFSISAAWDYAAEGTTVPASMVLDLNFVDFGQPVTVPAPVNPWERFVSKTHRLTAGHPSDWIPEAHRRGSDFIDSPTGDFFAIDSVRGARGVSLEAINEGAVEDIQSSWAEEGYNLVVDQTTYLSVGDKPAIAVHLVDDSRNQFIGEAQVVIGNRAYFLGYYAYAPDSAAASALFEDFLTTVQFGN
jgi:hypothetical protein